MASIRAETPRTHKEQIGILQPSRSFLACSDTVSPLEASMQPVPLAKLDTCQNQKAPSCERSHDGPSQMERREVDPFLVFGNSGDPSMKSEKFLVVDEVRLIFGHNLTICCNRGLIETGKS